MTDVVPVVLFSQIPKGTPSKRSPDTRRVADRCDVTGATLRVLAPYGSRKSFRSQQLMGTTFWSNFGPLIMGDRPILSRETRCLRSTFPENDPASAQQKQGTAPPTLISGGSRCPLEPLGGGFSPRSLQTKRRAGCVWCLAAPQWSEIWSRSKSWVCSLLSNMPSQQQHNHRRVLMIRKLSQETTNPPSELAYAYATLYTHKLF